MRKIRGSHEEGEQDATGIEESADKTCSSDMLAEVLHSSEGDGGDERVRSK